MPRGDPGFEWWLADDEVWKPSLIDAHRANPNLHLLAVSALHREWHADPGCLSWMTRGQRMLLSTTEVENHVNQGGFSKLWCYGGWALAPAAEGYRLLGAADVAEVLERTLGVADWTRAGGRRPADRRAGRGDIASRGRVLRVRDVPDRDQDPRTQERVHRREPGGVPGGGVRGVRGSVRPLRAQFRGRNPCGPAERSSGRIELRSRPVTIPARKSVMSQRNAS